MAKEVHHHPKDAHEEAPPSETAHHPKLMDQDDHASADKLQSLKSLNAMLLEETSDRRQQVDSLEHAKKALESELARFSAELGRAEPENVGLVLEKDVICTFLKTQMDEMSARVEMLVKQREAEVEGLSGTMSELADSLEKERAVLSDVSGERDSLKVERAGLVEKANLLKESPSEMEKVRRNLEGSFESLKLQSEKLIREIEEGEREVEAAMRERDSAKNSLAQAGAEAGELKSGVGVLVRVNKYLEMEKNRHRVEINNMEKGIAYLNEIQVSLSIVDGKMRDLAAVEWKEQMTRRIVGLIEEKHEKEETIEKLKEKNDSVVSLLKVMEKELEEKDRLVDAIVRKNLEMEEANYCKQNEIAGLLREICELKNNITGLESTLRNQVDKNKALLGELWSSREACDQVTLERDNVQKSLDEEKQNAMNFAKARKRRVFCTLLLSALASVAYIARSLSSSREARDQVILERDNVQKSLDEEEKQNAIIKAEDLEQHIELLQAKAHKQNGFWTLLSSAATLFAVAASVAWIARGC